MAATLFSLIAAAFSAAALARRLCGDAYAAALAGTAYALSPAAWILAGSSPRIGAGAALLPAFLILFYRSTEGPRDDSFLENSGAWLLPSACLGILAALDARLSVAWGFAAWLILLGGYLMDARRGARGYLWGPTFSRWAAVCAAGIVLYAPLWWWRLRHPLPPVTFPRVGAEALDLFRPSSRYLGTASLALAAAGVMLSRSYRGPARLWGALAGLMIWLGLGSDFLVGGRLFWWAPALYRLVVRLPWLRGVEPAFYAAAGQLAVALVAAFGFTALLARAEARHVRWLRPLACAAALGLLAADALLH